MHLRTSGKYGRRDGGAIQLTLRTARHCADVCCRRPDGGPNTLGQARTQINPASWSTATRNGCPASTAATRRSGRLVCRAHAITMLLREIAATLAGSRPQSITPRCRAREKTVCPTIVSPRTGAAGECRSRRSRQSGRCSWTVAEAAGIRTTERRRERRQRTQHCRRCWRSRRPSLAADAHPT